jgi:hypothetical protein
MTWLSEDGNSFHARSKQLLDGSAYVMIRVLNPKKGWTADLADSGEMNREHSPGISPSDFSRLASRDFPQFFELFDSRRRKSCVVIVHVNVRRDTTPNRALTNVHPTH